MSPLPSQRGTATTQHAGLQPGQPVATAWTAEQDQELVVNEFAASADEDRRSARQARPLLLVALGRRASEPEAVRRDAEEDLGAACAGRLTRERRAAGAGSCREARSEWCRQRGRPALPEHLDRTRSEGRAGEDKRIERKQCEERLVLAVDSTWRLTRLDFAATMTLPSDLYDGLDPTPAASVLAYTDLCTNASPSGQPRRFERRQKNAQWIESRARSNIYGAHS